MRLYAFIVSENRHCKSKHRPFREKKKNRKETIAAVMYFSTERDRLTSTVVEGWKRPVL